MLYVKYAMINLIMNYYDKQLTFISKFRHQRQFEISTVHNKKCSILNRTDIKSVLFFGTKKRKNLYNLNILLNK